MHRSADPNPTPSPHEICGYPIECALTPGQSYLATGPGGRNVVLKKLDEDCLLRGKLHPSIKERLSRVRELAHGGVANLHGVDRDGEFAYLIWEYVPGKTFDEYAADVARTPHDLLVLARELILSVESLHMQGIVHGAITGGNVIVASDGAIRLTHVSPLLYSDMSVDVESVVSLLEQAAQCRGEEGSPLGQLVAEATREQMPLRVLGAKVAALLEPREQPGDPQVQIEERQIRRRTIVAAAAVTMLGVVIGYSVWRVVDRGADPRGSFQWILHWAAEK